MTGALDETVARHWLVDYLVTNMGCSPDEIDCDASMHDLGVGSRDWWCSPVNCPSFWAGPFLRWNSGSTRPSIRWRGFLAAGARISN